MLVESPRLSANVLPAFSAHDLRSLETMIGKTIGGLPAMSASGSTLDIMVAALASALREKIEVR